MSCLGKILLKVIRCDYIFPYPNPSKKKLLNIYVLPPLLLFFFSGISVKTNVSTLDFFLCAKCWFFFDCMDTKRWVTQHLIIHIHAQWNFKSVFFENYSNYFPPFWSIFLPKWPIIIYFYYYWEIYASFRIHLFLVCRSWGCKSDICS